MKKLALFVFLLAGCDQAVIPTDLAPKFEGYGGLKLGMSYSEATAITGTSIFNPVSVQKCERDLPIRGCLLNPISNLVNFISRDGIGYGIQLAFNKYDRLTDIDFHFERSTMEDEGQRISLKDCEAISIRTIDWLTAEFGKLDSKAREGTIPAMTPKGSPYFESASNHSKSYFAEADKELPDGREINLLTYYIQLDSGAITCDVRVGFAESREVERWKMSPEEDAEFERTTGTKN